MILMALSKGADGVLVVGCREGECHYTRGTYLGRSKLALLRQMMSQMGIPPSRVRFSEMGSLDRFLFPKLVHQMREEIMAPAAAMA
jgi:coenzyme F420-reducing hydrogenase delta subunit